MKENIQDLKLESSAHLSNRVLIKRMFGLAWEYRWGCVNILLVNLLLLAMALYGLGLTGVGIDFIRRRMWETETRLSAPHTAAFTAAGAPQTGAGTANSSHAGVGPGPKPPKWPLGLKPPDSWPPLRILLVMAMGILFLALARAVLSFLNVIMTNKLVQGRVVVNLRARVYSKLQEMSFRFFDENASGSLINRVTRDVQAVRQFIDGVVIETITLFLSLVLFLVFMTRIHVVLTVCCLVTTPLLWILTARFSRTVRPAYGENLRLFDRLILALSENIQGAHVVKGFASQEQQIERFGRINDTFQNQQFWIFDKTSTFQPLIGFVTNINLVVMLALGGYLAIRHELDPNQAAASGLSIGQLLVFAGLLQQFSGQVVNIANISNSIQQSLTGAQRVFEILDAETEIRAPANPRDFQSCRGEVKFANVSFSYNRTDDVLRDIDFVVEPGRCAAILGQTGSGKSTLLSLIPRFYDPDRGAVFIDGADIRELDPHALRRRIGLVFQESFLFSNTVAANIAFGSVNASIEQIRQAAKIACAHDFITRMPQGYETVLHEGGIDLSGGQRQRIAIARAILMDPAILLLDDPSASIDAETENEIMEAVENATKGRTTFIVAHKLSMLRRADSVIVLGRGRIIQSGTHDELMKIHGAYSMAANLQIPDEESLRILGDISGQ